LAVLQTVIMPGCSHTGPVQLYPASPPQTCCSTEYTRHVSVGDLRSVSDRLGN